MSKVNELQQADLIRHAEYARDHGGSFRLHELVLDAVAAIRRKDDLINRLLDRIEKLEEGKQPAAA